MEKKKKKNILLYHACTQTHTSYSVIKNQLHPLHPNSWDSCLGYSSHADIIGGGWGCAGIEGGLSQPLLPNPAPTISHVSHTQIKFFTNIYHQHFS